MAPSRGRGRIKGAKNGTQTSRRAVASSSTGEGEIPPVYRDLLAEAEVDDLFEHTHPDAQRPLKKRRITSRTSRPDPTAPQANGRETNGAATQQTAEASSEEEESDLDFEDIDLEHPQALESNQQEADIADVSITIDQTASSPRRSQPKRKPASASEKAFRLVVHKMHILCLLGHCMYVNSRCNDEEVQQRLRKLVPKKTVAWLNHPAHHSQFDRDRVFTDGLKQISELFRGAFMVTESGLQRAKWLVDGDAPMEPSDFDLVDRSAFVAAAKEMRGSQDTGNQLLCAMLRSVGVEARLVCSLQCLPFGKAPLSPATPSKNAKPIIYATTIAAQSEKSGSNNEDRSVGNSETVGRVPAVRRRLGQPGFPSEPSTPSTPSKKKRPVRKLTYPVFWVEAFNAAYQRWVAVDPLVTQTVSTQPTGKLEPPSSYEFNQMAYVFAFESNSIVRDVTRRYTRAFNAKTRRNRVESTENGAQWLKRALRIFRRRGTALDRDAIEDAELAKLEMKEGLPSNVLDFKDHPYYALERHLKRHEVIHPKREVGKVNAGTAAKPRMEIAYRRADVCVCRSAEKWFRLGQEVKQGEVPVKRVPARGQRQVDDDERGEDEEPESTTGLYASFQTELYVPAPVVRGKVPRNAYGNLDVYVPSMVPAGGAHIRHQLASQAAKILKIDYSDAVTGFQFKGRHGTAITEGVIVAEEYADAVKAVVEGLEDERTEEESKARSAIALRMWRRFLTGLRIAERVSAYGDAKVADVKMEIDAVQDEQDSTAEAGGFFPGDAGEVFALPTAGRFSLDELMTPSKKQKRLLGRQERDESEEETEFTAESEEELSVPSRRSTRARRTLVEPDSGDEDLSHVPGDSELEGGFVHDDAYGDANSEGGGFLPDVEHFPGDGDGQAGGFLPEESDEPNNRDDYGAGGFLADGVDDNKGESNAAMAIDETVARDEILSNQPDEPKEDFMMHGALVSDPGFLAYADSKPEGNMYADKLDVSQPDGLTGGASAQLDGVVAENYIPSVAQDAPNDNDDAQSDHGSMISHDPEDEDAEPDWLASDSD